MTCHTGRNSAHVISIMNLQWIFHLIFAALALTPTNSSTDKVKVTLGIYSPTDSGWYDVLTRVRGISSLGTTSVDMEFFKISDTESRTLKGALEVREAIRSMDPAAVIGPYSESIHLASDDLGVPYIVVSWTYNDTGIDSYDFRLLPHQHVVHDAAVDVIEAYEWERAAVIYDSQEGLYMIGKLMELREFSVKAWKIPEGGGTLRLRDDLLEIRQAEYRKVVLVCSKQNVEQILEQALRLSMLSDRYNWILVSLRPGAINYTRYENTGVNFTMLSLYELPEHSLLDLHEAVAQDAIDVVTQAAWSWRASCVRNCGSSVKGPDLGEFIKSTNMTGKTGVVRFNQRSGRENVTLMVYTLLVNGSSQFGTWVQNPEPDQPRLHIRPVTPHSTQLIHPLGSGIVRIVIILEAPFVMLKKDHEKYTGNDRYEGYLIDLIAEIANHLEFDYELYEVPDKAYGSRNAKGEWNGMIRELIIGNASMCLGAISITAEREQAVDFAKPFKQKTFNILLKKPKSKTSVFQFLWPLAPTIWFMTVTCTMVVALQLYVMDRFSPNKGQDRKRLFNMSECLWFIYASLVGAGTDTVPRTASGRLLTGVWWFFSLILISSYTANLAAFLTVTKIDTPIKSLADLAAQNKIKYGTVKNTYSMSFFRSSNIDIFKKMWTFMSKLHPDSLVDNSTVGIEKVKQGNYAFIWDEPINKYTTSYECDTMVVGEPFDQKGYGIGVPLGASYRDRITMALLTLNEEGTTQRLEDKWWSQGKCAAFKDTATTTKELNLQNVAGVFVILAAGAAVASVISLVEYLWRRSKLKKAKDREIMDCRDNSTVALRSSFAQNGLGSQDSPGGYKPQSFL